jgi:acyl-coenzyme A thioesterase PaaI-like protein
MAFDFLEIIQRIPTPQIRHSLLNRILERKIPFNRGLGLKIRTLNDELCEVASKPHRRRNNHVGGAHACFLALMAEYAAGLVLAQRFSLAKYRLILKEIKVSYEKQGRSSLLATARLNTTLDTTSDEEQFIPMVTQITDGYGNLVAEGQTLWQVKPWEKVRRNSK